MLNVSRYLKKPKIDPAKVATTVGAPAGVAGAVTLFLGQSAGMVALWCVIGIMVLTFLVRRLVRWIGRARGGVLETLLDSEHRKAVESSGAEERVKLQDLRERFQFAVKELKRAGKTIYELPWLLLIGESQSGKSMTLRGSDLHFPVGTDRLSGLGGTKNCDWWFTNEAVILDTAGRFTFQQEGTSDRQEWEGFLQQLARRRRLCPINGVLVVIPVDRLLNDPPELRKDKAKNILGRLNQVQRTMGVQFPVFVLITKCDLVLGFSETFREFGNVQAAQMVGWSNRAPFDQRYEPEQFTQDFDVIAKRLSENRLEALRRIPSLEERGLLYAFPEEFRALGPPLQQYLSVIFAPDIYHDSLFFRGVYFTSGIQEGIPIARIASEFLGGGRTVTSASKEFDPLGKLFPPRPFFCADVYKAKALRETRMVFRSSRDIKKGKRRRLFTYVGGGSLAGVLAVFAVFGAIQIGRLIEDPRNHVGLACLNLGSTDAASDFKGPSDPQQLLPLLKSDGDKLSASSRWQRWALLFKDTTQVAQNVKKVRDHLYFRSILRPKVEQLEGLLSSRWPAESQSAFEESLTEYVRWYAGAPANPSAVDVTRLLAPVCSADSACSDLAAVYATAHEDRLAARRRGALGGGAAESSSRLQPMLLAAENAFALRYAGEKSETLGPWVDLFGLCDAVAKRHQELLGLEPQIAKVDTLTDYDAALREWRDAYQRFPFDHEKPSFEPAYSRIVAILSELGSDAKPKDGEKQTKCGLVLPEFDVVRKPWVEFFGESAGSSSSESLHQLAANTGVLEDDERTRLQTLAAGVTARLDAVAKQIIEEKIKRGCERQATIVQGTKVSDQFALTHKALKKLDDELPETRTAKLPAHFLDWPDAVCPKSTEGSSETGLATAKSDKPTKNAPSPAPNPGGPLAADPALSKELDALAAAVHKTARRHTAYVELNTACDRLNPNQPLEHLLPEWDVEVPKDVCGWDGMRTWLTGTVLRKTRNAAAELEQGLQRGECRPLQSTQGLDERLRKNLIASFDGYAQRYFRTWNEMYGRGGLDGYEELTSVVQTWKDYYAALLTTKVDKRVLAESIRAQAEKQLSTFVQSVLSVEVGDPESTLETIGSLNDTINHAREVAEGEERDSRFFDLHYKYEQWKTAPPGRDKTGTAPSSEGEKRGLLHVEAGQAFHAFRLSVAALKTDLLESERVENLNDLDDGRLWKLTEAFPQERILQQLWRISLRGRELANRKIDTELFDRLSVFWQKNSGAIAVRLFDVFPFAYADKLTAEPPELSYTQFRKFLLEMVEFEKRYNQIGYGELPRLCKGALTDGRTEFMNRSTQWREFFYGSAREGKDPGSQRLQKGDPPLPVFFQVQSLPPSGEKQGFTVRDYTHADVRIGRTQPAAGVDPKDSPFLASFANDPRELANRVWQFQHPGDVSLVLTGPRSRGIAGELDLPPTYPVPEVDLKGRHFSVPMFIYRYCSDNNPAVIAIGTPGALKPRQVWRFEVEIQIVPVSGQPRGKTSGVFEVRFGASLPGGEVSSDQLPELIGSFSGLSSSVCKIDYRVE